MIKNTQQTSSYIVVVYKEDIITTLNQTISFAKWISPNSLRFPKFPFGEFKISFQLVSAVYSIIKFSFTILSVLDLGKLNSPTRDMSLKLHLSNISALNLL